MNINLKFVVKYPLEKMLLTWFLLNILNQILWFATGFEQMGHI